ncbi:MAG TPA: MASE1 domain-containing protein [Clostridia bacterium]|nr:MASE1 domain-containing protein [Clostridia bacterium]
MLEHGNVSCSEQHSTERVPLESRFSLRSVLSGIVVAAATFVAGLLFLKLGTSVGYVSAIWPPLGIAVAALVLLGRRMWPAVAVAAFCISLLNRVPPHLSFFVALGTTAEALAAATLLSKVRGFRPSLQRVADVLSLTLLAGCFATIIGATIGVLTLCTGGLLPWSGFYEAWIFWWLGDVLGVIVVASTIMVLGSRPDFRIFRRRIPELALVTVLLIASSFIVFSSSLALMRPVSYMIFACVVWAAFRFEQLGAVLSSFCASAIAIASNIYHIKNFTPDVQAQNITLLQTSLAVMVFTALVMAAVSWERSAVDQELRRSESRLRATNRAANLGAWDWDLQTGTLVWIEEVPSLSGLGFLNATMWHERIHPEDRDNVIGAIAEAREQCGEYHTEYRIPNRDGELIWIMTKGMFLPSASGQACRAIGVSLDITERKRSEHELQQREAQLRILAEAIPQLVWTAQPDGSVDYINRRWQDYTGLSLEQSAGSNWLSVVHPEDLEGRNRRWARSLQTGQVFDIEHRMRRDSDGEYRWHLVRALPLRDSDGKVVKWFGTCTDIDDQKNKEEILRRTEKLAATGRLAASIAHEINNPLAAVANLLYLLNCDAKLSDEARHYVNMAEAELSRVTHITRQTLMFYRESSSPLILKTSEVLDNVLDLYSRKISQAQVTVERRYDSEGLIRTMPGELRQIFSNLIVNAVEASPPRGRIIIHVREARDWKNRSVTGVRISIADCGAGISRRHIREIFEPFFTTKGDKGTGLGLWITHGLVIKNDGFTRVRSSTRPGQSGSCFTIFLPCNLSSSGERDAAFSAARS